MLTRIDIERHLPHSGDAYDVIVAGGGLGDDTDYRKGIKNGHAYPYRCLLPKGVDGLLVAGRCASLSHMALTICKNMGNMMAIGQAAGTAASIAVRDGAEPRNADVNKIQERLRETGVII